MNPDEPILSEIDRRVSLFISAARKLPAEKQTAQPPSRRGG